MRKKIVFVLTLLSFAFLFGVVADFFASAPRARNISVFRIDGDHAQIARSRGGREVNARDGQRVSSGNVITTGRDTQVNFALVDDDIAAIWKMDVSSRVQVSTARRRLALTISLGNALVNITSQEAGHNTYIMVGSMAFSVRGTMFTISKMDDGHALIVMLSGEGVVEMSDAEGNRVEVPLGAGQMLAVYENGIVEEPVSIIVENLPLFTLEEIVNNYEYLLDVGTITEDMLEEAMHLIPILTEERDRYRAYWDSYADTFMQENPPDVILFPFEDYDDYDEENELTEVYVSPELRAAAEAFADVLQSYIDIHGIAPEMWQLGVRGAKLLELDESGVPTLIVDYLGGEWHSDNTVVYVFTNGQAIAQLEIRDPGAAEPPHFEAAIDGTGMWYLVKRLYFWGGDSKDFFRVLNGELTVVASIGVRSDWGDFTTDAFFVNSIEVSEQEYNNAYAQLDIVEYRWEIERPYDVLAALRRLLD